jgi:adenine-specific DNA methylase
VIPKDCKRLAEVDFPIAEVSRHAAREKSIRHGHPSTLHLWWARRPLASSRAVLLGLVLPDPCDPLCPEGFKVKARQLLPKVQGRLGPADEDLRKALLKFIGNFADWDLAANRSYLDVSRALVKATHGEDSPLVVDPFAGGGSIPVEALRLGCEVFASDLNPVACLILKVMLEDIPRHGPKLAEELRRVGAEIRRRAEQELADLYPKDPDGATPIAYLWARTVRCESPNCGAEIPLLRSFWLCKKAGRRRALRHRVIRHAGEPSRVEFEIFEPKTEKEVPGGTVTRAKATCLCCGSPSRPTVLPPERVRAQLTAQRGGANVSFDAHGRRMGGARMLAVVTLRPSEQGRHYRLPIERDYGSVWKAQERLTAILHEWEASGRKGLCPVPDEPLKRVPVRFGVINVWVYGMDTWGDLFSNRQKLSLMRLALLAREQGDARLHALAVDRLADYSSSLCRWVPQGEFIGNTFGRQALPMVWDFCEVNPFSTATGGYPGALEWVASVMESMAVSQPGQTAIASATCSPLPDASCTVWFTDPPYYDAVPYSYISDFFYVWLKRILETADPVAFGHLLSPKKQEIVAYLDHKGRATSAYEAYEKQMAHAFAEGRRILSDNGIGSVVFAHKTTEGWEALLSGMTKGGWTITGSWPVATEMQARLRAKDSATLATSVHLICRPRLADAPVGDWAEVLRELPKRVGDWMERLQGEGVRGADLVFACIGPALEIFSRYAKVETADGREVALAEYLEKVWEVVGRSALAQVLGTVEARARNGAAGAVEEDARLTALFLWTLQSTNGETAEGASDEGQDEGAADDEEDEEGSSGGKAKGFTLVFDVVRRFAQPLGIDLPKWEGRVIETKKGVVRLLPIAERAKQLFGPDGAQAVAARLEKEAAVGTNSLQGMLFPEMHPGAAPAIRRYGRGRGKPPGVEVSDESLTAGREATTLDRVHAAMLLQAGGRTNALRALLKAEQERGPDFLRLSNALSALYPKGSEEKRLLDAMLLAVPR